MTSSPENTRPLIEAFLQKQLQVIYSKAHDYAQDEDVHSNFKYSDMVASRFKEPYLSYAVLIGTKLARLAELLGGKEPKNESIEDSFLDLANYVALMMERWKFEQAANQYNVEYVHPTPEPPVPMKHFRIDNPSERLQRIIPRQVREQVKEEEWRTDG